MAGHPDWLEAPAVKELLTGNTITALAESGRFRWWIHYRDDRLLLWKNDFGKEERGEWSVNRNGRYCVAWQSGFQQCWRLRHTGKVVRFDNPESGRPGLAAVLQAGDSRGMAAGMAPEAYQATLAAPRPEASDAGAASAVGSAETPADELRPIRTVTEEPPFLTLRVVHRDPEAPAVLMEGLTGVRLAAANEPADLIWDVPKHEIGDDRRIIAYLRTNETTEVQMVIDRRRFVEALQEMTGGRPESLAIQLEPQRETYHAGDEISLSITGRSFGHNILFNIGPYGRVDMIYPVDSDFTAGGAGWPRVAPGLPFSVSAVAGAPLGANLVVAVSAPSEPQVLLKTLKSGGGPAGLAAFLKAIDETDGQLAIAKLYIER